MLEPARLIGILAGGGSLPREIADRLKSAGRGVHVVSIEGESDGEFGGHSHAAVNWGGIGRMLASFRTAGARELLIIGRVRRPDPWRVKADLGFVRNLPTLLRLMGSGGDDGVMRGVIGFFEAQGFRVVGPAEVAPWLYVAEGPLGAHAAGAQARRDIALGLACVRRLGAYDIGQGVVVTDGRIEAIEGAEGTDAMLARVARHRRARGLEIESRRGVLVKRKKPGQEPRVDVPAIGPETALRADEAGLSGIALEADQVITAERAQMLARADRAGLFVEGVREPDAGECQGEGRGQGESEGQGEGESEGQRWVASQSIATARRPQAAVDVAARRGLSRPIATLHRPSATEIADASLGLAVSSSLKDLDVAGAVVVSRGHVLAVEASEGARDLLIRAARLRQWHDSRSRRRRGVAVLAGAPALEADLVALAADAGLKGLLVWGGSSPRAAAIATANAAGMFIIEKTGPAPPETSLTTVSRTRPLRLFIVTGEHSGDALGAALMRALNRRLPGSITYRGVGGPEMAQAGLQSQFPLDDVAVMGPLSILRRLPGLIARVHECVAAGLAMEPDAVVIIDAPEFTHRIAQRIREKAPDIPILDYVSPSVWAWRPGRARKMRPYVDHILALLPFEPAAHARLGGPPCTYVGHPLVERLDWLEALDPGPLARRLHLDPHRPVLVVLPGSRTTEVERLMGPFGETMARLSHEPAPPQIIIPAVDNVRSLIEARLKDWPMAGSDVHLVAGEADKFAAFKLARLALAASGTVTLELGLAGTPMVVAYRTDAIMGRLRFLLSIHSVVLANLVLGTNAFPEYIQENCTPKKLAPALRQLMAEGPMRDKQLAALAEMRRIMRDGVARPSERAADLVMDYAIRTGTRPSSGKARVAPPMMARELDA